MLIKTLSRRLIINNNFNIVEIMRFNIIQFKFK